MTDKEREIYRASIRILTFERFQAHAEASGLDTEARVHLAMASATNLLNRVLNTRYEFIEEEHKMIKIFALVSTSEHYDGEENFIGKDTEIIGIFSTAQLAADYNKQRKLFAEVECWEVDGLVQS